MPLTVMFIPGLGGSSLYTRSDEKSPYRKDWLDLGDLLSINSGIGFAAWKRRLMVRFDRNTLNFVAETGEICADVGDRLKNVSHFGPGNVLGNLTTVLREQFKGRVGLEAMPYNWLMITSAAHLNAFIDRLTTRIEELWPERVILVSHSMGAFLTMIFLQRKSLAWKERHIASWIPVNGAFAGTPAAIRGIISGDSFGMDMFARRSTDQQFQELCQFAAGGSIMLPHCGVYENIQILHRGGESFQPKHIDHVITHLASIQSADVYRLISLPLQRSLVYLSDDVTPLIGVRVDAICTRKDEPTDIAYRYDSHTPYPVPESAVYRHLYSADGLASDLQNKIRGNTPLADMRGDGTLPFICLNVPRLWTETASMVTVRGDSHALCFTNERVVSAIMTAVAAVERL
jgi:pimeloyl-ACP methyl ester carboxylesterase